MAIYTRFRPDEVKIVGRCGNHLPQGWQVTVELVKVKLAETDEGEYAFISGLWADDGLNEILAAVNQAELITLEGAALEAAIKEAS